MKVVGGEVGRIGNIPLKLLIDLPFLRSITEIVLFFTRLLKSILYVLRGILS